MLSKIAQRSLRRQIQNYRCFSEIIKKDAVAGNIVAQPSQNALFKTEQYGQEALKEYFEQDALLFPVEEIVNKVQVRDFRFFLEHENFLKVVDTLEKFESGIVDLDSQAGKDFIVFKRQLYQVYQIQNRSVQEHESFSFEIERENLKWLSQANKDFLASIQENDKIDELVNAKSLNGLIFKRKMMDTNKL